MSNYLQRLVTPAIATPARTVQPGLQEINAVVPAPPVPAAPAASAGPKPPPVATLEQVRQWVSASAHTPDAGPAGEHQTHPAVQVSFEPLGVAAPRRPAAQHEVSPVAPAAVPMMDPAPDAPARSRPQAHAAMDPHVETPTLPPAAARLSPRAAGPERPRRPSSAARAPQAARPAERTPAAGGVAEVHVGSITLTVKAPPPAPAPSVPAPAAHPPNAATGPRQAAAPAPEGLRFSASRHHLRWS